MQYDCPAGWEDIVVGIEIVGFEVEPAEGRRHGEGLPIGQVDDRGRHVCRYYVRMLLPWPSSMYALP